MRRTIFSSAELAYRQHTNGHCGWRQLSRRTVFGQVNDSCQIGGGSPFGLDNLDRPGNEVNGRKYRQTRQANHDHGVCTRSRSRPAPRKTPNTLALCSLRKKSINSWETGRFSLVTLDHTKPTNLVTAPSNQGRSPR